MFRSILAVAAGYVTAALFVVVSLYAGYTVLGPDRVFVPGLYRPSSLWLALALLSGIVAAVLGGWVAARVAGAWGPVLALASFLLVLGIVSALLESRSPSPLDALRMPGRPADTRTAMERARQPDWFPFLQPIVGVAGVLLGGALRLRGLGSSRQD